MSSSESQEVPAVCETCLGPNPYVEMVREINGEECKLCTRPFTIYRWAPVKNGKFKKTIICLSCAKAKNCCQSCMLDLTYGINLELRDSVLKLAGVKTIEDSISTKQGVNSLTKAYMADQRDRMYETEQQREEEDEDDDAKREKARILLQKISTTASKNKKNFKDNRDNNILSKTDVSKLISKLPFNGTLSKLPKDESIKSFFIFGINDDLPEFGIKNFFEIEYDSRIQSMVINHKAKCGFIIFQSRSNAIATANKIYTSILTKNKLESYNRPCLLVIDKVPIRISWGKYRSLGNTNLEHNKLSAVVKKQMIVLAEKDKLKKN
ncbi:hypothetical protein PACTADRAFT_48755 [Pachysolen tannophilus NRRL Y-2460]|uniref:Pre-mRNA-splicing factor SLT11 n=1 Tax=Pachysolen tannophilus NRRL Y-2460 TaxID=669874 RepID=A0A1E4TZ03_PACTA|nr:hypothetical protein PACTADRAFT_48755 [Pachysolen tannophilus NRRL Y-2460]